MPRVDGAADTRALITFVVRAQVLPDRAGSLGDRGFVEDDSLAVHRSADRPSETCQLRRRTLGALPPAVNRGS